jgi:glutathione S-transferase
LSSYCHKVLIALYELGLSFEPVMVNPGDPASREAFLRLWPTGKIPLLVDDGKPVPETSIMIEYLQQKHAPDSQLLPVEWQTCLEARLWDRLSDQYVMTPVQAVVGQLLREPAQRDALADANARTTLKMAYDMIERQLADNRPWIVGQTFTMADCATAPALFYAHTIVPFAAEHEHLKAYFERLITRTSVARVLEEAKPWLKYYPLHDSVPARFL